MIKDLMIIIMILILILTDQANDLKCKSPV